MLQVPVPWQVPWQVRALIQICREQVPAWRQVLQGKRPEPVQAQDILRSRARELGIQSSQTEVCRLSFPLACHRASFQASVQDHLQKMSAEEQVQYTRDHQRKMLVGEQVRCIPDLQPVRELVLVQCIQVLRRM